MATPFLSFTPLATGYNFSPADNNVVTKLDGGQARIRRDVLGGTHTVNAQWILNRTEYTQFMAFVEEGIQDASLSFRVNLLSTTFNVVPHVVRFANGKPRLTQQSGDASYVSGVLEVTPNPTKSYTLFLQNVAIPQFVDAGTGYYAGDLSQFPVGRQVMFVDTEGTVNGTAMQLNGTYQIATAPNVFTRTFVDVAANTINPNWALLNSLPAQSYFVPAGAAILLPL